MSENLLHINESVEAYGHPTECAEPVSGSVSGTGFPSVTINGDPLTQGGADTMEFSSHAHDYTSEDGCHQSESHSITLDASTSVSVNGNPVGIIGSKTDPTTGGSIEAESTSLSE